MIHERLHDILILFCFVFFFFFGIRLPHQPNNDDTRIQSKKNKYKKRNREEAKGK